MNDEETLEVAEGLFRDPPTLVFRPVRTRVINESQIPDLAVAEVRGGLLVMPLRGQGRAACFVPDLTYADLCPQEDEEDEEVDSADED